MGRNSIDNGHEDVEHAVSGMHTCCALALSHSQNSQYKI